MRLYPYYEGERWMEAYNFFWNIVPSRPDLRDPPNRKWLGLDGQLPPQPEYHPVRLEKPSQ